MVLISFLLSLCQIGGLGCLLLLTFLNESKKLVVLFGLSGLAAFINMFLIQSSNSFHILAGIAGVGIVILSTLMFLRLKRRQFSLDIRP